ncbi:MAG: PQQ-binding-like beta-propeller repeat protein [Bacteroidales bacterium]|nr:PQQ-binding-like beta-propeller repeat protein [Bacteroidales bacterium]
MKNHLFTFIIFFILCTAIAQEAEQWRGPNRDGNYPETGLLNVWPDNGPELLWHYDSLGAGYSSAAVTPQAIFLSGAEEQTGYIFSLDHEGNLLWKTPYGVEWTESFPGSRSTPLYYDGKLYMVSGMGKIFCLDAGDGRMIWDIDLIEKYGAVNIKWGITENLAFLGNKIFCVPGGEKHNVIALDKDNGNLIWSSEAMGEISAYCSPNIVNHNGLDLFITQTQNSIIGLNALTGEYLWSHTQPNEWSVHANTPYYRDGRVYCVSGYGKGGVALQLSPDGKNVTELWRDDNLDGRMGSFVVIRDYIYGPADKGLKWFGLEWETGKKVFGENIIKKGNITLADGMLYLYGEDGNVVLAEPKQGQIIEKYRFRVPYGDEQHWAFPVFNQKKMYLRHGNSLMVYKLEAK